MNDKSMSRVQRHQHKNWNPFSKPVEQPRDPNFPAAVARYKFASNSGYPKKGTLYIEQLTDGTFHFTGHGVDPNPRYYLKHFYWNGYTNKKKTVKPAKTIEKKKHGLTRGIVGGIVAGVPGEALGAYTAKKETTYIDAKTKDAGEPLNAFIELANIQTGQNLRIEMLVMFNDAWVTGFEKTFKMNHEIEHSQYY